MESNTIGFFSFIFGMSLGAFFTPIIPFLFGVLFFNIVDIYSAISLSRRVQDDMIDDNINISNKKVKFNIKKALKSLDKFFLMILTIMLAHFLDVVILSHLNTLYLASYTTGVIAVVFGKGILSNASSSNGEKWAMLLQKILDDKTEKYYNINLEELKK